MTVVSSNEFIRNQDKYFDLAMDENIMIERGGNMFHLTYSPVEISNMPEQQILKPDDDYYRVLSSGEFRGKLAVVLENIDKKYANK